MILPRRFHGATAATIEPHEAGIGDRAVPSTPHALLLSAAEASLLCGVSVRQWWRWDSTGNVPASVRIGKTKRWRRDELVAWIAAGCPSRIEWASAEPRGT